MTVNYETFLFYLLIVTIFDTSSLTRLDFFHVVLGTSTAVKSCLFLKLTVNMDVIQSIFLGIATGASIVSIVLLFMIFDEVVEIRKELNKQK